MDKMKSATQQYYDNGWALIPLKSCSKLPQKGFKWSTEKMNQEFIDSRSCSNLGVALGERSQGLIDLDFDIQEAGIIGNLIFPDLHGFGRKGSPNAHKLLLCPEWNKTRQFEITEPEAQQAGFAKEEKRTIFEVRGNGGYTMIPPSTHPSGEELYWHKSRSSNLITMGKDELKRKAGITAFLAIILKTYPTEAGNRDNICMALAGALLRAGLSPQEVDECVVFIASQKGDEEAEKRRKAEASKEHMDNDGHTVGLPRLCELLGIELMLPKLHLWLYGEKPAKSSSVVSHNSSSALEAIEKLNEQFFVIENEGGKCLIGFFEKDVIRKNTKRERLYFQSFGDFSKRFDNQKINVSEEEGKQQLTPLGKLWINHPLRRQYERIVFLPNDDVPDNMLNLWRGYSMEAKKTSCRLLLRHVYFVLANKDKEAFKYIMRWVAWTVQNPQYPAEVALVFKGGKGTGKGTFANALLKIFGQHSLAITSAQHITGRFNSHLRDCVFLFADEALAPQDRQAESVLKGLITEPTITIEGKGKDLITSSNHLHVMMASNENWVVPASKDERRFAVFDVSDCKAQKDEWFKPLYEEMANGGLEGLLHLLLNLNLNDWHPRKSIPNNKALTDQRIQSLCALDQFWFECLLEGIIPEEVIDSDVLITRELSAATRTNTKAAGEFLKEMGGQQARTATSRGWRMPNLRKARKLWSQKRWPYEWDEHDEWAYSFKPDHPPF